MQKEEKKKKKKKKRPIVVCVCASTFRVTRYVTERPNFVGRVQQKGVFLPDLKISVMARTAQENARDDGFGGPQRAWFLAASLPQDSAFSFLFDQRDTGQGLAESTARPDLGVDFLVWLEAC